MCAKHYENPTVLSRVTAENVGDVFFETHYIYIIPLFPTVCRKQREEEKKKYCANMTII